MSQCLGIVKSTNSPCTAKARDINGFCHRHQKQSIEYAKHHKWSLISVKNGYHETLVKVSGIVEGAITTSEQFGC